MSQAELAERRSPPPLSSQWPVALAGMAALAAGALALAGNGWRFGALFVVGALLGATLYHAAFGFTSAYREAFVRRDVAGVRAQVVMLAAGILLFAPTLADGTTATGYRVTGALAPAGWEVALGSFLFGIGMQLGGGCGSGTLFTVGGGSTRMVLTLVFFCIGAFVGTLHWEFWGFLREGSRTVALGPRFGWGVATVGQVLLLGLIWLALGRWARGREQTPLWPGMPSRRTLLAGPWPLLLGAAMLALLNWVTLEVSGHAWSITWGFTLWAAEAAQALGWDPESSPFWAARSGFLERGIFRDDTSVMDMGVILGALVAAGLAGRFAPALRVPPRALAASILGGLLLGYGARLAYGCNIGAFFSGVVSGSLHGWLWILCALPGNWLGVRLRPWFGLSRSRAGPAVAA